jgi:fructokinase
MSQAASLSSPKTHHLIGIDLGGTKIEGILLDSLGNEVHRRRIPTPRNDYPGTLQAISQLVTHLEQGTGGKASVGIGIPGVVSPVTGLVKNANSTWLIGHPLDKDLEMILGRPVRLANDANCFAVSEAVDGAGAGAAVVFGVIIGTGCGGGIAVQQRIITGRQAIAGEWGHNPLPWPEGPDENPGPPCYCGKNGCIETFLSGPGLENSYARMFGERLTAPEIISQSVAGSDRAEAAVHRYEERMARALAGVINLLDPDVIVLGGGMSKIPRWYETVPRLLSQWVFSDACSTPIVPPKHGDSSGVRGAAWLCRDTW